MKYATWTNLEVAKLVSLFPTASKAEVMAAIPKHPWGSIRIKARKMGLHRPCAYRDWSGICAAHEMKTGLFEVQR